MLIILVWQLCWWGVKISSALYARSVVLLTEVKQQKGVAGLWLRFSASFPETSQLLQARFTTRRFSGLILTLIVLFMLYFLALFGGLVGELLEAEELIQVDHWINDQLTVIRTDSAVTTFAWLTDLGGSPALLAVAIVATGLLWAHQRTRLIAPLWLTVFGSQLMTYSGKFLLQRQRPESITGLVEVTPSFPSGHATSALAVYGFMAYIISRDLKTVRQRFELVYWTAVLIGLIGFSRLLLSVHYASDVAAGFLVGSFWLLLGIAVAEQSQRAR
jgi:undecaprenyl-diphosphatase